MRFPEDSYLPKIKSVRSSNSDVINPVVDDLFVGDGCKLIRNTIQNVPTTSDLFYSESLADKFSFQHIPKTFLLIDIRIYSVFSLKDKMRNITSLVVWSFHEKSLSIEYREFRGRGEVYTGNAFLA